MLHVDLYGLFQIYSLLLAFVTLLVLLCITQCVEINGNPAITFKHKSDKRCIVTDFAMD